MIRRNGFFKKIRRHVFKIILYFCTAFQQMIFRIILNKIVIA
jgi:hypothetical protein